MRRKIPSMEALVAFEASARHMSFTRAADELALTQSAVGRQVAILEQMLGVVLFNRIRRRISLTDAGRLYADRVRRALDRIERDTLAAMAHRADGGILELAVVPTFGSRWLIPRLPEFYALHPYITINLTTRAEPFLFTDTPFDAAIHFGSTVWPGTLSAPLFGEDIVPVCSPRLLNGAEQLEPDQLLALPLLQHALRPNLWRQWFAEAGLPRAACMQGARFELLSMLLEAARTGLGCALVPRFLASRELEEGSLVVACTLKLHSEQCYALVYPEQHRGAPRLQAFETWLLEAARRHRDGPAP